MNLQTLRDANVKRCEEVFHPLTAWSPTDWACAMAGECGEACNEVKKLKRLDGPTDPETLRLRVMREAMIACELADLVIYADLLAARLDIDLSEAIRSKFNDVSTRMNSTVRL